MKDDSPQKIVAGRYEILATLGQGGMGRVYLVLDRETGEKRAMKVLRQRWQYNDRIVARFSREVEALRRLNHPCILKILDTQNIDGQFFYIMEYVRGKSIRTWLNERGQLQFNSVVRVLSLVAHALEHAHQLTIHRDISPDNVMVTSDGTVRLLDFGLAKLDDAHQNLTMVGVNMGKIQYNSPEQQENASTVDHRADIYPLGIMFYEMLAGKRPDFNTSLLQVRPDLPASCEAFWRKAAARLPEDRFQSAQEFRLALMNIFERSQRRTGGPAQANPDDPTEPEAGAGLFARLRAWWVGLWHRGERDE